MNIQIIGTSHISPESIKKVEKTILEKKPGIVAIELDAKRLYALLNKGKTHISYKDIRRIGLKGWIFSIIGAWAERKLGAKVGVAPGSEMIKAATAARQVEAKIALIDQDIEITLKKFSKALTWKEKLNFISDVLKGVIFKKGIKIDLEKVPSQKTIQKLIADVKKRYPNIYKVLVEERNEFMARVLAKIMQQHPEEHIIAVVGAGHEQEIRKLLKKYLNTEKEA